MKKISLKKKETADENIQQKEDTEEWWWNLVAKTVKCNYSSNQQSLIA